MYFNNIYIYIYIYISQNIGDQIGQFLKKRLLGWQDNTLTQTV